MRILLVEDDEHVIKIITAALAEQTYTVDVATDGQEGWELAEGVPYDLVLLDVMLPKLDGISLCRRIRAQNNPVPILLLTARSTSNDKQIGLDAGADDYVVKPFDLRELLARIRAMLRRGSTAASPILSCGNLRLDPSSCEVTCGGQPLNLTRKEYSILELFLRHKGRVFSRSAILDQLWSFDEPPGEETVKAHIKGLRHKLKALGAEDLIETLYGQGYRLNPAYGAETGTSKSVEQDSKQALKQATNEIVARIWEQTKHTTFNRLAELEQIVGALVNKSFDEKLCHQAERIAHMLAGSLGTFGVPEGSDLARQLEVILEAGSQTIQAEKKQIQTLVANLRRVLESVSHAATGAVYKPEPQAKLINQDDKTHPLLLIADDDQELANYLAGQAGTWKLRTAIAPDLSSARQHISESCPDVVLLDLSFADTGEDGLSLLAELSNHKPPIPVLVFSARDRFIDRMTVARLGARTFLQKPTASDQVFKAVTQALQQSRPAAARIMAVDDDTQILQALRALLEPWGVQFTSVDNLLTFWETLEVVQPDLLILDVEMPTVNGLELCRAVRNSPRWNWLPIVFLSAHTGAEVSCRVFEVGGDDYVTKPIVAPELISRIFNRIERTHLLRNMAETDLLTGVLNRQRSTQDLEQFLHLAKHSQQSVCLAVLDVGNLHQINNQYGHATGDRVLRQLGQLLKEKLRQEDVVARWGGSEFVVAMYGMTKIDGVEWLADILETLRSTAFVASDEAIFHVNFSAGVAQYPVDGMDVQMLYRTAESVLHQAKLTGGDRVLPAGWQPLSEPVHSVDVALVHPKNDFTHLTVSALVTRGYHVRYFSDASEAIAALGGNHSTLRASWILVGGEFPDFDKFQVLNGLKPKGLRQSRVLMLTAQAAEAQKALKAGASDYLMTPCSVPVLVQHLRQAHNGNSRINK